MASSDFNQQLVDLGNLCLDPYEYRLYAHYKMLCAAAGGKCYEAVRTTAAHCRMSAGKVSETRQALIHLGLLRTGKYLELSDEVERLSESSDQCCRACGVDYPFLDKHHVVSQKDGGSDCDDNKTLLCPNCHRLVHRVTIEVRYE